jgi:hypothetical protein
MPTLGYMICCETQTVDATGLVSHINVLNSLLAVQVVAAGQQPLPGDQGASAGKMTVSATWIRDTGEEDAECEFEFIIRDPNGVDQSISRGTCRFEKPFHRIDIFLPHPPFTLVSGVHVIECRIRRQGTDEWTKQKYPFWVDIRLGELHQPAQR